MDTGMSRVWGSEHENPLLLTGVVLPDQFYTSPYTSYTKRPEASLMRAVLEDAFACFQAQFITSSTRALRLAREAEAWFSSDATNWPFAFVNICTVLGLDPTYVRQGLKRWHYQRPQEMRRKKRRVVMARRIDGIAA
jgi:hypothetical protein